MFFGLLLLIGIVGILTMTAMGFLHGSDHGGHNALHGVHHGHGPVVHHGDAGSLHAGMHHGAALPHAHVNGGGVHHPVASAHHIATGDGKTTTSNLSMGPTGLLGYIPSPLDLFSICLGAGAVGSVMQKHYPQVTVAIAAAIGGIVMNFLIVRPLFRIGLKFASTPSEGLEGLIAFPGQAITNFDATGKGLVKLTLDGQLVQLLATLEQDEHQKGVRVRKGDEVVVTQVNPRSSTCCVTRELSL